MADSPTAYPEVNVVLRELLPGVREILGDRLVGTYLTGSLAAGDFDRHSDVDFVTVTENEVGGEVFSALDALHQRPARAACAQILQPLRTFPWRFKPRRYERL